MHRSQSVAALLAALFAVFAEFAKLAVGCKCTGANTGVDVKKHGTDYGSRCAAWDDGKTSALNTGACTPQGSQVGKWCCRAWCYVDPETCNGVTTPFFSSFVQSSNSSSLFFSFAACDSVQGSGVRAYTLDKCPFDGPLNFAPDLIVLATVRNFDEGDAGTFGCSMCRPGMTKGLLLPQLSKSDGKPVLSSLGQSKYPSASGWSQWYTNGTKIVACLTFKMDNDRDIHYFESSRFLPPGVGKGLFTTELHVFFRYNGGEIFRFRGDDDVWVFINGRLAMDLGGCHGAMSGSVKLDDMAETLHITPKRNYEMAIFHAERCFGASNFMAEMTLRQDQGVCVNQCYVADEHGHCDTAAGKCICYEGWSGIDCGTSTKGTSGGTQGACASGITRPSATAAAQVVTQARRRSTSSGSASGHTSSHVFRLVVCAAFVALLGPLGTG